MKNIAERLNLVLGVLAWIPFILLKITLALFGPLFCLFIEKDHRPDILFVYHGGIEIEDWWWSYEQRLFGDVHLSKHVWLRTWWWYAVRNPVEGWKKVFKHPERFTEFNRWETFHGASNSPRAPVEPMESLPMLEAGITKWTRWRRSGWRLSYRKLVVPPTGEPQYREIYFGWKLGTSPPDLDFAMQYRKGRIGN